MSTSPNDVVRKPGDEQKETAVTNGNKKNSQVGANGDQHAVSPANECDVDAQVDEAVDAMQCDCVDLIPKPLDGGYGWVICLAAMTLNFILDGIGYAFSVFIPSFQEAFQGASKSSVAWIGALLGGVYMLSGPIASALVNKFGCRLVTMCGALFTTVSFIAAAGCLNSLIGTIVTFGVLGGFGFGLIYLPSIVCVGHYFEEKRALATGLTVCGSGIGMFVFAPLSEFLLSVMDLRSAIIWLAAIVLQCVWLGALLVPLEKKQVRIRNNRRIRPLQHASSDSSLQPELPRAKNTFDRIRERVCRWCSSVSQYSGSASELSCDSHADASAGVNEQKLDAIRKAKEARQARLESDNVQVSAKRAVVRRYDSITNADGAVIGGVESENVKEKIENECSDGAAETSSMTISPVTIAVDGIAASANEISASTSAVAVSPSAAVAATSDSQKSTPARRTPPSGTATLDRNRPHRARSSASASASYASNLRVPTNSNKNTSQSRTRCVSVLVQHEQEEALRSTLECLTSLSHLQRAYESQKAAGSPSAAHTKLHKDVARPLYRQDIFYSGSVINIDKYQRVEQAREQRPEAVPVHAYTASVICIPMATGNTGDQLDAAEKQTTAGTVASNVLQVDSASCCADLLPKSVTDVLAAMLNFKLLRVRAFALILIGNLFAMFGFIIPFMYLVDLARGMEKQGVSNPPAALLLTYTGVTNTIGRVLCGWASSQPNVNGLLLHNVTLAIAGLLTALVPFLQSYFALAVYALAYGLFISPFICLTSVILCDVVGVESLTNSFGLLCLVRGIVTIASSPFAGFLYDLTQTYTCSFLVSAITILIGAACHFLLLVPAFQTERMKQQIAARRAAALKRTRDAVAAKFTTKQDSSSSSEIQVYHQEAEAKSGAVAVAEVRVADERRKVSAESQAESVKLLTIQEERQESNCKTAVNV